jgi:Tol biopolymer transport system component/DNA-binding winged helix-turn-helix (wHTH) protein
VTYAFGDFRLDPAERLLIRRGQPVSLTPKAFDLLVYLVERHGRLVEKSTLMSVLWSDAVVEEANLAFQISALRKALDDGSDGEALIQTVPTRGYRFVGVVSETATAPAVATPPPRFRAWLIPIAASLAIVGIAGGWLVRRRPQPELPPPRLEQLTTLPGMEIFPSFSPDGEQVAFSWNPGPSLHDVTDHFHICVKLIGASDVRQLTSGPAHDLAPSWSPDGRRIAYVRTRDQFDTAIGRIHLVSLIGGSDLKLSDFPAGAVQIDWSVDGRYLIAGRRADPKETDRDTGIYLIPVAGGEPRALTHSQAPAIDLAPAFSPDGRQIAYATCDAACSIRVLDLDASLAPARSSRTIAAVRAVHRLTWTRDGRSVVYGSFESFFWSAHLWSVDARGGHAPVRIELAGSGAVGAAFARSRDRLAFNRVQYDPDIYSVRGTEAPRPVAASSVDDFDVALSMDGRRIAFSSARSVGADEIWVAEADGTNAFQLTHGPGKEQGMPRWSPDGRRIAFQSRAAAGGWHVWVIDAEGGTSRQITSAAGDQNYPTWSADGRWIYYSADSGDGPDIWRTPAVGGPPERLTLTGSGRMGYESPDGASLLFQRDTNDGPLLQMPLRGGTAREIVPCVAQASFKPSHEGIYYVACADRPSPSPGVHLMRPGKPGEHIVAILDKDWGDVFDVSPTGTVFYSRSVGPTSDLWLIENFR